MIDLHLDRDDVERLVSGIEKLSSVYADKTKPTDRHIRELRELDRLRVLLEAQL